jgi:hypothetical protein
LSKKGAGVDLTIAARIFIALSARMTPIFIQKWSKMIKK